MRGSTLAALTMFAGLGDSMSNLARAAARTTDQFKGFRQRTDLAIRKETALDKKRRKRKAQRRARRITQMHRK